MLLRESVGDFEECACFGRIYLFLSDKLQPSSASELFLELYFLVAVLALLVLG